MSLVPQPNATPRRRPESEAPLIWGLVLVGAGLLLLMVTLGILPVPTGGAIGVVLALAGFALLVSFLTLRMHWWTLIAGPTMLALGAVILLPNDPGGAIFLGGIGLGFGLVALTSARRWWAVIPAGVLLSLALVSGLGGSISGTLGGTILFAGLGATFGVLALIKVEGHAMSWPIYPALGCLAFALLIAGSQLGAILWPVVLIGAGALLLLRATTRRE